LAVVYVKSTNWHSTVDMSVRLDTVPALEIRADRQTDRFVITISRSACISTLTRDN